MNILILVVVLLLIAYFLRKEEGFGGTDPGLFTQLYADRPFYTIPVYAPPGYYVRGPGRRRRRWRRHWRRRRHPWFGYPYWY